MSTTIARATSVQIAGATFEIAEEALVGFSPALARAYRVLPLGEYNDYFIVLTDDYAPEVAREFIAALATKPTLEIPVSSEELDTAISSVFGDDDRPARPLASLAEILVESDTLTPEQVTEAALYAASTGTSLGPAAIELGYINPWSLALLVARYHPLPVVNLRTRLDTSFAADFLPQEMLRTHRIVPLTVTEETATIAMVDPLDADFLREIAALTGKEIRPVLTTDRDVDWALRRLYRTDNIATSTTGLVRTQPENSAHVTFERRQIASSAVLALVIFVGLMLDWVRTLVVVNVLLTTIYLMFSFYKAYLILRGGIANLAITTSEADIAALRDEELPMFTLLIPLYNEAAIVPTLLTAIANLDYPAIKLDVKILLEEEDIATLAAVYAARPPEHFKVVRVPDSLPKTKPKACNYGLIEATGELLVIYDAEDIPDPDQLKKCVVAFRKAPPTVACIQARLNYFNPYENLLTRWFTLEYSQWFDLFLPGLSVTHAPIPLGGTSNFFITERLIEAGAWDPYNVTEDADLGVRLYKLGYGTAVLDSTTYEEANTRYGNWIRQRSRWIKGYMQTWLVHNRHPWQLWRELGTRDFLSMQATVGGTFVMPLINPIFWVLTIIALATRAHLIQVLFPPALFYCASCALYIGNFVFVYINVIGCLQRGYFRLVVAALLSPLYWVLMSIAAYKALWQLITKPFYWEKTSHGLSTVRAAAVPGGSDHARKAAA